MSHDLPSRATSRDTLYVSRGAEEFSWRLERNVIIIIDAAMFRLQESTSIVDSITTTEPVAGLHFCSRCGHTEQ